MSEIYLQVMTKDLCHQFFKHFENDPAIFADMSRFTPYEYIQGQVDAYFEAQQSPTRIVFMVMKDDLPIGEVKLKSIDHANKECTLSIHMQNDSVKGKGYGTYAETLAMRFAFDVLGMTTINADTLLKNTRSQHILEKLGFRHTHTDTQFKYYRYERHKEIAKKGNIIFLNGVSSSGKTTLAKKLQSLLPTPYFHLSCDTFYNIMPDNKQTMENFVRAMTGMSHTIKAFSDVGISVIVDHILLKLYGTLEECVMLLHDYPVLFVHVDCPIEELRRREKERGDREIGQAGGQLMELNPQDTYDVTVDTYTLSLKECAKIIMDRSDDPQSFNAFKTLYTLMTKDS